ncbi:hypothetical protein [Nonomuraea rhizosphaerae]|nr:hypothetical protein [Nonomuraea rhizosphaerae]
MARATNRTYRTPVRARWIGGRPGPAGVTDRWMGGSVGERDQRPIRSSI